MANVNRFEDDIEAAQRASQSGVGELLAKQESKVLKRLVSAYKQSELTPEEAKIGIAVIAELRSMSADVARTIERGQRTVSNLTKGASQ